MLTSKSRFFATAVVTDTGPPGVRLADAGALAALAAPTALAPDATPESDLPPQATIRKDAEMAWSSRILDRAVVFIGMADYQRDRASIGTGLCSFAKL
jgi:hypothetical protein